MCKVWRTIRLMTGGIRLVREICVCGGVCFSLSCFKMSISHYGVPPSFSVLTQGTSLPAEQRVGETTVLFSPSLFMASTTPILRRGIPIRISRGRCRLMRCSCLCCSRRRRYVFYDLFHLGDDFYIIRRWRFHLWDLQNDPRRLGCLPLAFLSSCFLHQTNHTCYFTYLLRPPRWPTSNAPASSTTAQSP